jgi:hypothetical protein
MMRAVRLLLATYFVLAGCSDPSLQLSIELPDDYLGPDAPPEPDNEVATLEIRVLRAADNLDCDAVAFADPSADALAAATHEIISVAVDEDINLSDVPRETDKLFVVTGQNQDGDEIAGGCSPLGVVDDDATLTVALQPTTKLDVIPGVANQLGRVRLNDHNGRPFSWDKGQGIGVRLAIRSPDPNIVSQIEYTTDGIVVFDDVDRPTVPGPYSVEIRAEWQVDSPFRFPFLNEGETWECDCAVGVTDTCSEGLAGSALDFPTVGRVKIGRWGPAGEPAIAMLRNRNDQLELHVAYFNGSGDLVAQNQTVGFIAGGVATVRDGSGQEHLIFASGTWKRFSGLPGGVEDTLTDAPLPASVVGYSGGDCAGPGDDIALVQFLSANATSFRAIDADLNVSQGHPLSAPESAVNYLAGAGCVLDDSGTPRRTAAYARIADAADPQGDATLEVRTVFGGGLSTTSVPFVFGSVGFIDDYVVGSTLNLAGPQIALRSLESSPAGLQLSQVESIDTPAFATSIRSGQFDADDVPDLVSLIEFGSQGAVRFVGLFMAFQRDRETPLVGLGQSFAALDPVVFIQDLDGDAVDDIVIAQKTSYRVFLMGKGAAAQRQRCQQP